MDRGTSAASALRNRVVPLRLGYVAVANRSQADVASGRPISEARRAEAAWFARHPEYSSAELSPRCGGPALARRVNAVLEAHVRGALPSLRRAVGEALAGRRRELAACGEALDLSSDSARSVI